MNRTEAVALGPIRGPLSGALLLVGVATLILAWTTLSEPTTRLLSLSFAIAGGLLLYLLLFRAPIDPLEPLLPVFGMYLVMFYVRGLVLYFDVMPLLVNPQVDANRHLIDDALFWVSLGLVAFTAAYVGSGPRSRADPAAVASAWDDPSLPRKALVLYWGGLFAPLLRTNFMQAHVPAGKTLALVLILVDLVPYFGMTLYGYLYWSGRRAHGRMLALMASLLAFLGLLTGFREPMVMTAVFLLVARHYAGHRVRVTQVALLFFLIVFVIAPIGTAYRALVWDQQLSSLDPATWAAIPGQAQQLVQQQADLYDIAGAGGYFGTLALAITQRLHGMDSLVAIMARVPSRIPFQHGRTISFLPVSVLIPRIIWPDKPDTGLGIYFRDTFWDGTGGSIAMTQPGELFLNFGGVGIVLGMAVLGLLHRRAYEFFAARRTPITLCFYALVLYHFLVIERDLVMVYATLAKFGVAFIPLYLYLRRRPGAAGAGA